MAPPDHKEHKHSKDAPLAGGGQDQRSDSLLPGDQGAEDGRFDVAEEVSLDQHSDQARRVGQVRGNDAADALADTLQSETDAGGTHGDTRADTAGAPRPGKA
jgi:hypothetical protein